MGVNNWEGVTSETNPLTVIFEDNVQHNGESDEVALPWKHSIDLPINREMATKCLLYTNWSTETDEEDAKKVTLFLLG